MGLLITCKFLSKYNSKSVRSVKSTKMLSLILIIGQSDILNEIKPR